MKSTTHSKGVDSIVIAGDRGATDDGFFIVGIDKFAGCEEVDEFVVVAMPIEAVNTSSSVVLSFS